MVSDSVRAYLSEIGRKGGQKGGKASGVKKGLAALPLARRREIARLGGLASRKK